MVQPILVKLMIKEIQMVQEFKIFRMEMFLKDFLLMVKNLVWVNMKNMVHIVIMEILKIIK